MGSTAENLVNREFESRGPRAVLLTDITYIPLNGKFCYLSTILDACTKQVLSYAVSESLEVDFVLEMVERLVQNHGTSLNKETVIHSDQGDPLHQLEVYPVGEEPGAAPVHVPQGQLLGQRTPGELFRAHEGRAGRGDTRLDILCRCERIH